MTIPLGSFTSGVDGSSEGGRVNTAQLPGFLVLYGVSLIAALRARGHRAKLGVRPEQVEGVWRLVLTYEGDEAPPAPELWHGHHVIVEPAGA